MSDIEQVEHIKQVVSWASSNWHTWGDRKRIEVAEEIVVQLRQVKDEYWKDYVHKSIRFYQRVYSYIIEAQKRS